MDLSEYQAMFTAEATEYLNALGDYLLLLEKNPHDQEVLAELFRAAHSLKGMSATVGLEDLSSLAHEMETLLDQFRKQTLSVSSQAITVLLQAVEAMENMLDKFSKDPSSYKPDPRRDLTDKIHAVIGDGDTAVYPDEEMPDVRLAQWEVELLQKTVTDGTIYRVDVHLVDNVRMKSVRAYTVHRALGELGEIVKSFPPVEDIEEERFGHSFGLVLVSSHPQEKVEHTLAGIPDLASFRVEILNFDQMEDDSQSDNTKDASPDKVIPKVRDFIRVDTQRIDALVNLTGELTITRNNIMELLDQTKDSDLVEAVRRLDRLTTDLYRGIMKLRMVPIRELFDRFPRMVRNFSIEHNKDVQLEMLGEDTELDRSIVNHLADPLVHLVRNAIDHGVESVDERVKKGKPSQAKVTLSAYQEGSYVVIEVKDDGAGIDVNRVREKAISNGLITKQQAQSLSEEDIVQYVFHAGLSTKKEVTDISGRGVGMDVVKKAVDSMKGSVYIDTRKDEYTQITIRLPLTLSITQALLVKEKDIHYAIPVDVVIENLRLRSKDIKQVYGQGMLNLRGEVIPIIPLQELLTGEKRDEGAVLSVVIVEANRQKLGLVVDQLLGQLEVVTKSLPRELLHHEGVAGATVLGSGEVALIIDVNNLLHTGRGRG
ncbi:MAG: chemotaxis protein CheA [Limnochordia bacterium]|nr:chemotaxis protein CheA [Limnochordia bacterium]MDD2628642.1 chemotaxis protein CheA [Limnochordia bacterium]MDD4516941.1 chemotaxis protein CheA [Limnochordia bacterium]